VAAEGELLLLGHGPAREALAGRLFMLRLRAVGAETVPEAGPLVVGRELRAVVVHPAAAFTAEELRGLAKEAGERRLPLIAVGPRPADPRRLKALRAAGVELGVWEPFRDGELRFVLNRACGEPGAENRRTPRVPADFDAEVVSATGTKRVGVYNLSVGGAYLETTRPTAVGGRVSVRLPLPSGELELPARVRSTNVPGNLQRPNLPMGMGVVFESVSEAAREALARYVADRESVYRI